MRHSDVLGTYRMLDRKWRYLGNMDDRPEVRIGSAERERAQNALSAHFSAGRLDVHEFEDRSGVAAAARTLGDLTAVFSDLPGGLPAALSAPQVKAVRPGRSRLPSGVLRSIAAPALMVLLLLGVLTGHGWLLFIMLPISGAARKRAWTAGPHRLDGPGFHQR